MYVLMTFLPTVRNMRYYSKVGFTDSPFSCGVIDSSSNAPKKSALLSIQRAMARYSVGDSETL
jgi:hypothetical protein